MGSRTKNSPSRESTLEGHDQSSQTTTPNKFPAEDFSRVPIVQRKPEPIVSEERMALIPCCAFASKIKA